MSLYATSMAQEEADWLTEIVIIWLSIPKSCHTKIYFYHGTIGESNLLYQRRVTYSSRTKCGPLSSFQWHAEPVEIQHMISIKLLKIQFLELRKTFEGYYLVKSQLPSSILDIHDWRVHMFKESGIWSTFRFGVNMYKWTRFLTHEICFNFLEKWANARAACEKLQATRYTPDFEPLTKDEQRQTSH